MQFSSILSDIFRAAFNLTGSSLDLQLVVIRIFPLILQRRVSRGADYMFLCFPRSFYHKVEERIDVEVKEIVEGSLLEGDFCDRCGNLFLHSNAHVAVCSPHTFAHGRNDDQAWLLNAEDTSISFLIQQSV